jgi:hypothetical protein
MIDGLVIAGVLGLRFLVPLTILRYPLPGIIGSILADVIDGAVFDTFTSVSLENYQQYDKSLDIYYLSIAYIATLRNWVDPTALRISRFLWYYRLVGVALFAATDERMLLFVFPATFELFFIYYETARLRWKPERLGARHLVIVAAVASVFVKLPHEYWLHVAEGSTTEWIIESVFGMEPGTSRLELLAAYPWLIPAALLGAAALAAAVAISVRWLPSPDHPLSFDANRHGPGAVGIEGRPRPTEPILTMAVAEKVVLVALVSIIFASFLPGVDATAFQLSVVVAVVVVINAGIASWQGRRGWEWRAATTEFGTMLVANSATVIAVATLAQWADMTLSTGSALFYGLLLSLLVTLYDRYRHQRIWWVLSTMPGRPVAPVDGVASAEP